MAENFLPDLLPQIGSPIGQQSPISDAPFSWQSILDFGGKGLGDLGGMGNMLGGFGSLASFGSDVFDIYGGFKQLGMMEDMFASQEKYAAANLHNQSVLTDERREKQRATLGSLGGTPYTTGFQDNPAEIKHTV